MGSRDSGGFLPADPRLSLGTASTAARGRKGFSLGLPVMAALQPLLSASSARPGTHHVLLSNVALNEAVRVLLFEELREGGIFGVSIQGDDAVTGVAQLGEGQSVGLPGGYLWGGAKPLSTTEAHVPGGVWSLV